MPFSGYKCNLNDLGSLLCSGESAHLYLLYSYLWQVFLSTSRAQVPVIGVQENLSAARCALCVRKLPILDIPETCLPNILAISWKSPSLNQISQESNACCSHLPPPLGTMLTPYPLLLSPQSLFTGLAS